jgi:hypothetical protein
MSSPSVYSALERKRAQIETAIRDYEARLAKARADLATVDAAMAIFAPDGKRMASPHKALQKLFGSRELMTLCKTSLASEGQLTTRELAIRAMAAKGMDAGDLEMQNAITRRLSQSLQAQMRRGGVKAIRRPGRAQLWEAMPVQKGNG